ncbi:hypothetical protein NDU88_004383 [Pleurodeles waltl]|uniref:Secreted protein n=1 Tax=Pleurodeles waltl TaxID=8319 RepID=A0AAV7VJ46_PLEWA|nr:hypothetical protein NDU88_004383 [Pleurodeles waltl]
MMHGALMASICFPCTRPMQLHILPGMALVTGAPGIYHCHRPAVGGGVPRRRLARRTEVPAVAHTGAKCRLAEGRDSRHCKETKQGSEDDVQQHGNK